MAHGDYQRRRVAERRPGRGRPPKGPGLNKGKNKSKKIQKKPKTVSIKNQIRSTERMLRKELPLEVRAAQEKKMEELRNQQDLQTRLAVERAIFLRNRRVKFFERRKIERRIRRLEKQQRTPSEESSDAAISEQLAKLKEDLEYVRFFPKTEKYVPLFVGGDSVQIVEKRSKLRNQIKDNLVAAASNGKDLEETGSDDDEHIDGSEDDFFLTGSSTDEDADDELTDKSAREPASSTSGKAASGMSSDEKNQRLISDRARMPPPRPRGNSFRGSNQARFSSRNQNRYQPTYSTSSNTSHSRTSTSSRNWNSSNMRPDHSSTLSSNSDAHKPRRKRRPKKKKQVA